MVAAEVQAAMDNMKLEKEFPRGGQKEKKEDDDDSDDEQNRELQVIVGGFEEETAEEDIVQTVEDFLAEGGRRNRVKRVFTFSDRARVGVIEFESEASKIGFYKKVRNSSKTSGNITLWFTNNRTYQQRVRDRTLGLIKHHLVESKSIPSEDVKIVWKKGVVKVKHNKVAWVSTDATMLLKGVAEEVRDDVEEDIEEWKRKRGTNRSTE